MRPPEQFVVLALKHLAIPRHLKPFFLLILGKAQHIKFLDTFHNFYLENLTSLR